MNDRQTNNLKTHVVQIASSMIGQITVEDTIMTLNPNNSISPDAASNHHLIEILSKMDSGIFIHYCLTLFRWLSNPENGYSDHPFTLDSYTNFCDRGDSNNTLFSDTIARHQLRDGSIPIYTALIQGGDFFSTLWAVKILLRYDRNRFQDVIESGLDYLLTKHKIATRTPSQRGFLLFVLSMYHSPKYTDSISTLLPEIKAQGDKISFGGNVTQVIDDIYILEDLLKVYELAEDTEAEHIVERQLIELFDLDSDPNIPRTFMRFRDLKPEAPFYQLLLKAAQVAVGYLALKGNHSLAVELNAHLHDGYRQTRYECLAMGKKLKEYKRQYSSIEKEFRHYDEALNGMWEQSDSDYDHSIFLMMPFQTDLKHRALTKSIREACQSHGFKVFRVDDEFRKPYDTLWDNIVVNMLACKYGISVYLSSKGIDKFTDELRFFENPNVALEFGFMKSRGRKILILKDKNSKTPSDLQGFVWKQFDIENPDTTVASPIDEWINEFLKVENDGDHTTSNETSN
jgi:hypothetical protein